MYGRLAWSACRYKIRNKTGDDLIQRRNWKFRATCFLGIALLFAVVLFIGTLDNAPQMARQNMKDISKAIDVTPIRFERHPTIKEQDTASSEPLPYTEEELYMMSHLIGGEAGASWAIDIHQQAVGLVVMNRVGSHLFPNTMEEVIFQNGQYACTWDGNYEKEPSDRVIENAKKVLTGETDIEFPPNVVFQSTQRLGDGVYYQIYDEVLNNTTYFCYSNK